MSQGPVLALDCSGDLCSAAVLAGKELWEHHVVRPGEQLKLLYPMAMETLREAGLQASDLTRLAVSVGPGSFTGLRLAITTVRTMAQVLNLPVVPVSTLQAIAWSIVQYWRSDPYRLDVSPAVAVVTDARKGQVFVAGYRVVDNTLQPLTEPQALYPHEAAAWLREVGWQVVGGSGFVAYPNELVPQGPASALIVPPEEALPHARHVARAAAEEYGAVVAVHYSEVLPVYVRPPDVKPPKVANP